MSDELVRLERHDNGVAVITLDRPKVNALSAGLVAQLADVADDLHADLPGAVVLTGGPRVFAAGADIGEFGGQDDARRINAEIRRALDTIASIPRATIAAVCGYALGGGCEVAMACDMRIAGETANFGQPEILLGIFPGGGGTQRLARLVGSSRAKEIMYSGRMVGAAEAQQIGLANEVVADDVVIDTALERASSFASGAVLAHAAIKAAVDSGLDGEIAEGLDREGDLFVDVFGTEDSQIGVKSFLEHGPGKAKFVGK